MNDDRKKELRLRREAKAQEREYARLRDKNGNRILQDMNDILGADFSPPVDGAGTVARDSPILAARIEESQGLVAAYIGGARARQILSCCQAVVGREFAADVWFEEKRYMGVFRCERLRISALADLAAALEDRVFAASASGPDVLFVVDRYVQAWTRKETDFSVVVQSEALEPSLKDCFLLQPPLSERL